MSSRLPNALSNQTVPALPSEKPAIPETLIEPPKRWASLELKELWAYRELLYFLIWRDIKVRYKQTVLGGAWAIIQPFFTMVVFSLFFGKLGKIPSDNIPYPLFSYAGLLPWSYFAQAVNESSNSLVGSAHLIRKVYFPRLVIPMSGVLAGLLDFAIAFSVLLVMMVYYGFSPGKGLVLLPAFLLLAIITAQGVGLWFSALNVEFRDVRFVIPFFIQFWLFATPVAYPSSMLHEPWRTIYGLNPMVGVVEGFRWSLLNTRPPGPMILLSAIMAILLLVSGAYYFRKMERQFADIV
jgi:lipopolysaccharide transport system permease protein